MTFVLALTYLFYPNPIPKPNVKFHRNPNNWLIFNSYPGMN